MQQALWTKQGETLSHKNACKEFGLEEREIIDAMKSGKLHNTKKTMLMEIHISGCCEEKFGL